MEFKVNTALSPGFEILGLIYCHYHHEIYDESHVSSSMAELGFNAGELYKKSGNMIKRYVAAFEKKIDLQDGDAVFFKGDLNELIVFLGIFFSETPEWLEGMDDISEEEARKELMEGLGLWLSDGSISENTSANEIINTLNKVGFTPDVCWRVMLMVQEPKQQLQHLVSIIRRNMPAYESALSAIEKPLKQCLANFQKANSNIEGQKTRQRLRAMSEIVRPSTGIHAVTPILISPFAELVILDTIYSGLFSDELFRITENSQKAPTANPIFKALSDSSKFDIMLALKQSPKYNLELAEHMGLTAATISHHMQMLLLHGIVSVEKRDGRVYYTLQKDVIKEAAEQLLEVFDV